MARGRRPGTTLRGSKEGRPLAMLRRLGFRRGIMGGSRVWTTVAVSVWGYRKLKQLAQRDEEVVYSDELLPGQRLIIANARDTVDSESPQLVRRRRRR